MYEFVNFTFNVIKGACYHDCSYCYMKRWGKLNPIRFDEKELKTDLGKGNFIFVGSSNDMFAKEVPDEWIREVKKHLDKFDNKYLLQTKNPARYFDYGFSDNYILGTTIESNRHYDEIKGNTPEPWKRAIPMMMIDNKKFVTIEPILDFDLDGFVTMLERINPYFINIGADSMNNGLPEPSQKKVNELIKRLSFSKITIKKNMKRII